MPTTKQRRQSARRRLQRQLDRRREAARRRRQRNSIIAVVVGVLVIVGGVTFSITKFGGDGSNQAAAAPTPSASAKPPLPTRTPPAKPKRDPKKTSGPCGYHETATTLASAYTFDEGLPPDPNPTPNKGTIGVTLKTGVGNIVLSLDQHAAPCAVQSFLYLVDKGFFTQSVCHRLTTQGIFVLQCGDPTGTGQGGPTYQFKDENLSTASYTKGIVAMANSGPNTNGSQFFLIYKDSTSLPKKYTVIGTISDGLDVVTKVAKAGEDDANGPGDGHPKTDVIIQGITRG